MQGNAVNKKATRSLFAIPSVQTIIASLLCIVAGLLIGYIVLLLINPSGATESILNVIRNFFTWSRPQQQLKQFGMDGKQSLAKGEYTVFVGGGQPGFTDGVLSAKVDL